VLKYAKTDDFRRFFLVFQHMDRCEPEVDGGLEEVLKNFPRYEQSDFREVFWLPAKPRCQAIRRDAVQIEVKWFFAHVGYWT
jgi:hypothetical protein